VAAIIITIINVNVRVLLCMPCLADICIAWLVGQSAGHEMVLDICRCAAGAASHYTHLHGPADHGRHRQPQGKQTHR